MTPEIALLDANVLYPALLRDILLQLSFSGLYQARWSAEIDDEWKRSLLAVRPELAEQINRTQEVMRRAVPDALVTGYADLIPDLVLPDPDDRHVLAAAIVAHANVIVTFNLKDFPAEALDPFNIDAQHPDKFIRHMLDLAPSAVVDAVRDQQSRLINPPIPMSELLALFEKNGLVETVTELRRLMNS